MAINDYIERITNNDSALQEIHLIGMMCSDEDIAPLMKALVDNPMAAQRIKRLITYCNEITKINLQVLSNLVDLYISDSKL